MKIEKEGETETIKIEKDWKALLYQKGLVGIIRGLDLATGAGPQKAETVAGSGWGGGGGSDLNKYRGLKWFVCRCPLPTDIPGPCSLGTWASGQVGKHEGGLLDRVGYVRQVSTYEGGLLCRWVRRQVGKGTGGREARRQVAGGHIGRWRQGETDS
jgi:hypothetical protein